MAVKMFAKGTEEWMMFKDYYELCQKYFEPENTVEYWSALIAEFSMFNEKYKSEFATQLCIALFNTMEYKFEKGDIYGNKD